MRVKAKCAFCDRAGGVMRLANEVFEVSEARAAELAAVADVLDAPAEPTRRVVQTKSRKKA